MTIVHIGSGAGFAGDRCDAAVPVVATLARREGPRYLIYEVMAERTLAIAQRLKQSDPALGYSPWLTHYLPKVLKECVENNIRIVANFGNANPQAAARQTHAIAAELGIRKLRVAVVLGDDLLAFMTPDEFRSVPCVEGTSIAERELLGANAYLGAQPIARALALDVNIVLVGRCTDAALVLGPLIYEFDWGADAFDKLAMGTLAGHLLECGAQVSGGYFADPGYKDVPALDQVGYPLAEISDTGDLVITKAESTGGLVTRRTVAEQLLYEVHDPANYLTPDVTLDVTAVELEEIGPDRVRITGAKGKTPPTTLKVTLSVDGGWLGEGEISYAGPNALARATLAADVVKKRLKALATNAPSRVEILGTGAVHGSDDGQFGIDGLSVAGEFRLRVATRCASRKNAQRIVDEVLALYCCGPAGGGGVRQSVTGQVSTASILLDRQPIENAVQIMEIPA